jgi:hypothetical protein
MSAEELDNLVGRIALYPDDLVAIILPASTNPLQIVQADRFLDKRKSDPKLPLDDKWDDSVKALVNYPDVVKMMSGDLDWTSALGEAVVADQGAVLDAVQAFRRKVQAAGNLKSNDKQTVAVEKETITIIQSNPEVIYVPQYNPTTVVVAGAPAWGYYPTPYPVYYYPYAPGAAFATGLIWGAAIGAAWGGGHWNTNWGGGDININRNTNINTGNINRGNINTGNINRGNASQLPANRGGAGGGSTAWKPDKKPGQVSGATGRTNTTGRVGDARGGSGAGSFGGAGGAGAGGAGARPTPSSGSLGGGGNRPSTTQAGGMGGGGGGGAAAANRAGSVSASPRDSFGGSGASRGGSGGGSALGGYGSGRQTSMDSSRGASSRSSMSGGGARAGGGGGGARGGGGGGRGGGGRR